MSKTKAVAVDPAIKERNRKRLRRIEGQIRGLQKMVDEERYCADILVQISSVQEALRGVGRELLRNHLKHCATAAIRTVAQQFESMFTRMMLKSMRDAIGPDPMFGSDQQQMYQGMDRVGNCPAIDTRMQIGSGSTHVDLHTGQPLECHQLRGLVPVLPRRTMVNGLVVSARRSSLLD